MPRAKKPKPAEQVTDPVEQLSQGAAQLKPLTPEELAQPVTCGDVAAREPGEDFIGKPDPSGRYPGRENLPAHDLLHRIEPTDVPGLIGETVPGGRMQLTRDRNGLGIRFDIEGKPPAEALEPIKEERTYGQTVKRGMQYEPKLREWRKRPSGNPVGDALEVEGRFADAVKAMREKAPEGRTPF